MKNSNKLRLQCNMAVLSIQVSITGLSVSHAEVYRIRIIGSSLEAYRRSAGQVFLRVLWKQNFIFFFYNSPSGVSNLNTF